MKIKNISLLMICAFAVPAYATKEVSAASQTQEVHDYAKEAAANSNLALAEEMAELEHKNASFELGLMQAGMLWTGCGCALAAAIKEDVRYVIGGAIGLAFLIARYSLLNHNHKCIYDEKTYKKICHDSIDTAAGFGIGIPLLIFVYGAPFLQAMNEDANRATV